MYHFSSLMKFLSLSLTFHPLLLFSLLLLSRPIFASQNCTPSPSAPQDKIAVQFGYAIYSDVVRGSTVDGAGAVLCLDETGEVISPPPPPLICSLSKGSDPVELSYDSESGSLLANVTDLKFTTTHDSASVSFELNNIESPSDSDFRVIAADFSSDNGYLELAPGVPLVMARSNVDGFIPFTIEFTNGHLAGTYRGVVTVTCSI